MAETGEGEPSTRGWHRALSMASPRLRVTRSPRRCRCAQHDKLWETEVSREHIPRVDARMWFVSEGDVFSSAVTGVPDRQHRKRADRETRHS